MPSCRPAELVFRFVPVSRRSSSRRAVKAFALHRPSEPRPAEPVVAEEPLEIRIGGRPFVVTMRTPGDDVSLVAGLLATEGLVRSPGDLARIAPCRRVPPEAEGNVLDVELAGDAPFQWSRARRYLVVNSSCGLCGAERIGQVLRLIEPGMRGDRVEVPFATLAALPDGLRRGQRLFERTGGSHAAALFDAAGRRLGLAEDIGRHNAVDKLLGRQFLRGRWPLAGRVLVVSGRASFEIVQKAAVAGIPVVAAVSAPSTLAIDLAKKSGMTLVGFLRGGSGVAYAGEERLGGAAPARVARREGRSRRSSRRP